MSPEADAVLARLLPYPEDGSRADGPVAVDATDRLLLDEAAALIQQDPDGVVVIGDRYGALTLGALALGARDVRVHQDAITAEEALSANSSHASRTLWPGHERAAAHTPVPHTPVPHALVPHEPVPHEPARLGWTGYDNLEPRLLAGARLVLLQLPTSLAELTEIAEHVARYADPSVTLLAGGRVKHMTHAMNDVLSASFAQVSASLARQKSRLLIAREPRSDVGPLTYPVTARLTGPEILEALAPPSHSVIPSDSAASTDPAEPSGPVATPGQATQAGLVATPELATPTDPAAPSAPAGRAGLTVVAHGAAFAGAALDLGTRFLLAQAHRWPDLSAAQATPATATSDRSDRSDTDYLDGRPVAVDLGCGTGILATVLALRFPGAHVLATDRSAAACASARATLVVNGARATVVRGDAGDSLPLPDGSADLVLLNPPFHDRAALSTDAAHRMFDAAARMLRPGGELWTVFNTALHYRRALERAVGPTEHVAQNPKFTVTRSLRKVLNDVS